MTIVTDPSCPLTDVTASILARASFLMPFGAVGFELPGCAATKVSIFFHATDNLASPPYHYLKKGPNPPGAPNESVYLLSTGAPHNVIFGSAALPFDPAVGMVMYDLADGVVGDSTPAGDGIVDPGGLAIPASAAPTLSPWALLGTVVVLCLLANRRWRMPRPCP